MVMLPETMTEERCYISLDLTAELQTCKLLEFEETLSEEIETQKEKVIAQKYKRSYQWNWG